MDLKIECMRYTWKDHFYILIVNLYFMVWNDGIEKNVNLIDYNQSQIASKKRRIAQVCNTPLSSLKVVWCGLFTRYWNFPAP